MVVSLRWPNIVKGVYLVQVSLLLIDQAGFGAFLQVSALASHCTPMPEENDNQSTFINAQLWYSTCNKK